MYMLDQEETYYLCDFGNLHNNIIID